MPASVQSGLMEAVMAPLPYARTYHRFPLFYPVIFGGTPFVGEGILTNLSLMGCSVLCDREVLCGSDLRVSVMLPDQMRALSIELGTIKWVRGHQFGVEFLRLPLEARQRLNSTLRVELIELLKARSARGTSPELLNQGS
ncbi:MAG: PilZ domain-containing protein [Nitrospira sp. CG24C]|nr:MAG: PilZ domain-containing protein [Nitrospira sp. CG24C]TKB52943.1 MAG: PilZ domain-containing protein [Nitrospira sp.]